MSASSDSGRVYDPSYRQQDVDETLQDHEERITRNERWRLILKGAVAGIAMASGGQIAGGITDFILPLI